MLCIYCTTGFKITLQNFIAYVHNGDSLANTLFNLLTYLDNTGNLKAYDKVEVI